MADTYEIKDGRAKLTREIQIDGQFMRHSIESTKPEYNQTEEDMRRTCTCLLDEWEATKRREHDAPAV